MAACADAATLRAAIAEHRPDVVLTDIRMPPTLTDEGIQIAVELRRLGSRRRRRRAQPAHRAGVRAGPARRRLGPPGLSAQGAPARRDGADPRDPRGRGRRLGRRSARRRRAGPRARRAGELAAARADRERDGDPGHDRPGPQQHRHRRARWSSPSARSSATSTRSSSSSSCATPRTSAAASRRRWCTWPISSADPQGVRVEHNPRPCPLTDGAASAAVTQKRPIAPRRRWSCCSTSRSSSRSARPPTSSRTSSPTRTRPQASWASHSRPSGSSGRG